MREPFLRLKLGIGAATLAALTGFLVLPTAPASAEASPVSVRALALDTPYRELDYEYLQQLGSAFRESLENDVRKSGLKLGIDESPGRAYEAVRVLSKDLGLARAGYHDGLHEITVIGWKDKRMHLIQCRDNVRIDLEKGDCGTAVRKAFGAALNNAQIPFVWTGGIGKRFPKMDVRDGVGLKVESAPAEQVAKLTVPVLESIAAHLRSQTDWAVETGTPTQQDVQFIKRNGESVGIIKLHRKDAFELRTVVVLRGDGLQRVTCMHRLDDSYRSPESGACNARVQEAFGFSL